MNKKNTPLALVILDGWGIREEKEKNPIAETPTPFFDMLWNTFPHTTLQASGEAVGLPKGQMGNSEVGHMVIGSGMPLPTDLVRITKTLEEKKISENENFLSLLSHFSKEKTMEGEGVLHLYGLYSEGGVHSHSSHIKELIKEMKEKGVPSIFLHLFLDGRDTPPQSAADSIKDLEDFIEKDPTLCIASIGGRYYGMDRDNNTERTEKAYNSIVKGEGDYTDLPPHLYIKKMYEKGVGDEHIPPVVWKKEEGKARIKKGDALLCANFRADRARQIAYMLKKYTQENDIPFYTLTEYDPLLELPVLFPPIRPKETFAKSISDAGLLQAHIAETEKYPHITYYLNGGDETEHKGEKFILIPSRKDVKTHDEAPEMRAKEVAEAGKKALEEGFDILCINIANADMVGHTALPKAIEKAVSAVDSSLGLLYQEVVEKRNGVLCVTADHGNAEVLEEEGVPHTAHTTNPVPFIIAKKGNEKDFLREGGSLKDITPTLLSLLSLPLPKEMTGKSLYEKNKEEGV
jgi:2,3-bisphosphoglycerate-independent phosphoglycerate mutase